MSSEVASPQRLLCDFAPGAGPLDVIGESYLSLPEDLTSRVDTPDDASLDITGDIDLRAEVAPIWVAQSTPTALSSSTLLGKYSAFSTDRSYLLLVNQNGRLQLAWSTDGTGGTEQTRESTVPLPFYHLGRRAVRATLDVDDGGDHTVTFYVAPTLAGTWVVLGDPVTESGTTSIHASTTPLRVGVPTGGQDPFTGRGYRFEVRDGIDGTVVANPDFRSLAGGTTSFTDDAGLDWTLEVDAEVVGTPDWVDISDRLLVASWTHGRDDEFEHFGSGTASVVLRNDDREFDPDNTSGTWTGELLPRVPFRLRSIASALTLPGTAGATATTPDHPDYTVTDLDIRVRMAMDDWAPGGFGQVPVTKWGASGERSWFLWILSGGEPRLVFTEDGSTDIARSSTVPTGFADGSDHWLRVTLDVDDGSAQHVVTFLTSDDGIDWETLDTVTTAGTVSLFDSTADVEVGDDIPLVGQVRAFELRASIDGAIVAAPDFSAQRPGTRSFRDGAGRTWTVNGAAVIEHDETLLTDEFIGFVEDGFSVDPMPPAAANVTVPLVDLIGTMAGHSLPDVFDHAAIERRPTGYWTLDAVNEAERVTDLAGGNDGTVVGEGIQFGRRPVFASHDPAAEFTAETDGDKQVFGRVELTRSQLIGVLSGQLIVVTFRARAPAAFIRHTLFVQGDGSTGRRLHLLGVADDGHLEYRRQDAAGSGNRYRHPKRVVDGKGHIVFAATGLGLDDPELDTSTTSGTVPNVNGAGIGGMSGLTTLDHFDGWIGACAVWDDGPSLGGRQMIYDGSAKLDGLTSDVHVEWALQRVGIDAVHRDLDTGTVKPGPALTRDRDALEWMREVTATEGGALYIDHRAESVVRFRDRYHRFLDTRSTTVQATFTDDGDAMVSQHVARWGRGIKIEPNGIAGVINEANVRWRDGSVTARDDDSVEAFGPRPRDVATQATAPTIARSAGEWLVARYKDPRTRIRSIPINPSAAPTEFALLRRLRIGDRIRVRRHPQQVGAAETDDLWVEGIDQTAGPGMPWTATVRTSPVDSFTPWIWGTSEWGVDAFWG